MKTGANRIHRILYVCLVILMHHATLVVADEPAMKDSRRMLGYSYELWRETQYGSDPARTEAAAWIIATGPDGYACRKWPVTNASKRQTWNHGQPQGAIAIFHTHPAGTDPRPSLQDASLAREIGIEIYSISRKGIWKVTPDGRTFREEGPDWYASLDPEQATWCYDEP